MIAKYFDLTNRDIWVIGGAGYLGQGAIKLLLECGADVLCVDLDGRSKTFVESLDDSRLTAASCDISVERELSSFIEQKIKERGIPFGLVILTFGSTSKHFDELNGEEFDSANHIGLTSVFLMSRKVGTYMAKNGKGSIVLFSSMYGTVSPDPSIYKSPMNVNPIEYGVNKAGIVQMTKYIAVRWAKNGVRCNCISPGPFPHIDVQKKEPDFIRRLKKKVPMGRIGRPEEIGGPVTFLLSDASSFVTGQNIFVDGGWTVW